MKLAWGTRVSPEFRAKVVKIAAAIGCDPSWLMACMAFETDRTFSPSIRNAAGSGATGLIQFMPSTAVGLGTTVDELAEKTAEDQLDDVFRYFAPYSGRLLDLSDTYMAILYPAAIGLFDATVIFPAGSRAELMNRGLDLNHDNEVTKAEAASFVAKRLAEGLQDGNVLEMGSETQPAAPIEDQSTTLPQPETQMGAIAIPLLAQLIPQVLGLFSGRAQAQIAKATGASPDAAAAFMQNIIGQIGQVAGVPVTDGATATQAVAAITASPDATKVQQLEQHALDYLDKIAPMVDKIAQMDKDRWAADIAGRDAASVRAQRDRWDMTRWLVWIAGFTSTVLVLALLGAIIYQAVTGERKIDTALVGLGGPLLAIAMGVWREIFAYRFDGSATSNTARFIDRQVDLASKAT